MRPSGNKSRKGNEIIVLATPRFLPLLADDSKFLQSLAENAASKATPASFGVDILVGAVERLPLPELTIPKVSQTPHSAEWSRSAWGVEGISVSNVPRFEYNREQPLQDSLEPGKLAIRLVESQARHPRETQHALPRHYLTLKLADTRMLTGRPYVLFRQEWTHASSGTIKKTGEQTIQSLSVDCPFIHEALDPVSANLSEILTHHIQHITPPRKVRSALGNIIRSFEAKENDGSTGSIAASSELEEQVKSISANFATKPEVWALVLPENLVELFHQEPFNLRLLVNAGARMYRVSGGGGGWSGPGGPISLEVGDQPLSSEGEQETDFPNFGGMSAVRSGDHVAFFSSGLRNHSTGHAPSEMPSVAGCSRFKFASASVPDGWEPVAPFGQLLVPDYFGALTAQMGQVYTATTTPEDPKDTSDDGHLVHQSAMPPWTFAQFSCGPSSSPSGQEAPWHETK